MKIEEDTVFREIFQDLQKYESFIYPISCNKHQASNNRSTFRYPYWNKRHLLE